MWWIVGAGLVGLLVYDLVQRKHAILRNFPILGHFRYWFEAVGPELRQYIVTGNDEERPFSRDQRRWIYASAKGENSYFGFGTDNELDHVSQYLVVKHEPFGLDVPLPGRPGYDETWPLPSPKVMGGARGRAKAFRPASVVGISAMSFGSLSARAVEALNRGAAIADCLHNTGEGGVASHHDHGAGLIWQLGTGYFGARDAQGHFDLERFVETCAAHDVRAVEVKLSQGAKPGMGGVLPGAKVTPEIAAARGVPPGTDCVSPSTHSAFRDVDEMLDFVERLADATGLPIGIKSAVGTMDLWEDMARLMASGERGVDFITVDGGEGGTGAAPLVFSDHVALPFKVGMGRVHRVFAEAGLHERITFIGGGKLGFPEASLLAMTLGCDLVGVAREAMLAIGCIQAQTCHTGHCPTGVATQNRWLVRGLDPTDKAARVAGYLIALRKDLTRLARACGQPHPALVTHRSLELLDGTGGGRPVEEVYGHRPEWGLPGEADRAALRELLPA